MSLRYASGQTDVLIAILWRPATCKVIHCGLLQLSVHYRRTSESSDSHFLAFWTYQCVTNWF